MATLLYNNLDKTVKITYSNGMFTVVSQPVGWAVEKLFIQSNISYTSTTL